MRKKSLTVNSALNVIRQICAVIFPLITFPYATRVLGTANYGKVSFGASIISCIALVACLGVLEYAVREGARIRDDRKAFQKLADQIFSINVISTVVSYIILFTLILTWPRLNGYAVLLTVQSICVISNTLGTDWINTIYEDYLYIAVRYIASHLVALILLFIIVKGPEDYVQYAFTCVLTDLLANIANFFYVRKKYRIHPRFTFSMGGRKHIIPILILFGSTVASFIYINSDVVILGIDKDDDTVGIYSAASRIYIVIKQVLNAALAVTVPRVSHNISQGIDNTGLLQKIRTASLLFLLPASAGLFITGKNIILLLSGAEYAKAGSVLMILAVALFFATSGGYYFSVIMIPYGKEKWCLTGTVISASVNIILNLIFIPRYGIYAAAFTTVLSEIIMFAAGILATRKIVRMKLIKPYITGAVSIALITAASRLIMNSGLSNNLVLFITIGAGILLTALCVLVSYGKEVNLYFNRRKA